MALARVDMDSHGERRQHARISQVNRYEGERPTREVTRISHEDKYRPLISVPTENTW